MTFMNDVRAMQDVMKHYTSSSNAGTERRR